MTWSVVGHGPTGADPRSSWKTNPWRLLLRPAKPLGSLELLLTLEPGLWWKLVKVRGATLSSTVWGSNILRNLKVWASEGLGSGFVIAERLGMRMHLTVHHGHVTSQSYGPTETRRFLGGPSCPQKVGPAKIHSDLLCSSTETSHFDTARSVWIFKHELDTLSWSAGSLTSSFLDGGTQGSRRCI